MKQWLKWLWLQREGALVGAAWGVIALYASIGLSTLPGVALWQKFLIAPVIIAGWVLPAGVSASVAIGVTILIGTLIGVAVDAVYKPRQ